MTLIIILLFILAAPHILNFIVSIVEFFYYD